MKSGLSIMAVLAVLQLTGCGAAPSLGGLGAPVPQATPSPTSDAATRSTPVVVGRPARVFVFAGLGTRCEAIAAPEVTVTAAPAKGELSFKPGQPTIVATSVKGTCAGRDALGTGMYYLARAGSDGIDRFSVTARLASGEAITREFEVRIEQ